MLRQSRKLEHIKYALKLEDGPKNGGFDDICLVHNCLPEIAYDDVDICTKIANIPIEHPIIINAITGGAPDVKEINALLASLAKETNCAIAVGSQYAAIENPEVSETFSIVRDIHSQGVIFANLGAYVTVDDAKCAVEMIGANALQIHLNAAQEIMMREGDRNFHGYLKHIEDIVKAVKVPVIIKEVGCGIALEQAKQLIQTGIAAIDVGGAGGTNFIAIEAARIYHDISEQTLSWGLPTSISALEVREIMPQDMDLVVSGGVRSAQDVVKALAIGASAVAIAGEILKMLKKQGLDYTCKWMIELLDNIKRFMLLTGAQNIFELRKLPLVISGQTWHWLNERGIDTKKYAQRSMVKLNS